MYLLMTQLRDIYQQYLRVPGRCVAACSPREDRVGCATRAAVPQLYRLGYRGGRPSPRTPAQHRAHYTDTGAWLLTAARPWFAMSFLLVSLMSNVRKHFTSKYCYIH